VTSGDVTVSMILERGSVPLAHIGPVQDRSVFEEVETCTGKAPQLKSLEEAELVICTGLFDVEKETPEDYDAQLSSMLARGLDLICANPDLVVHVGDHLEYCAGAIAERYENMGGKVIQAGKPYPPIYEKALAMAASLRSEPIDLGRGLAIGDTMRTDVRGGQDQGLSTLFVTSGIHRDELHPAGNPKLDETAFRQFLTGAGYAPSAALPELVW
jgi:HAD superfamily hydrolase (TIGR01459 family)